jgi:septum site-determining protein MinD
MGYMAAKAGARVVTITSGKGGVGKTTTTANLGIALARLGKKVVVMDADIGLRNLDIVMGLENRIVYDLVDVIEGRCQLRQAMIKHKQFPELYLIPAAQTRDKTAISPTDMVNITDKLRPEFDFIIIDCPAGIERGFRNAIAAADEVLIVTNPEVSAVRDADRIIGLLEANNKGPVPEDENVIPASNSGVPVALNENSKAGIAFRNIARRLCGEEVPLMPVQDTNVGFFQRLTRLFGGN